jgi:hypothetical protein
VLRRTQRGGRCGDDPVQYCKGTIYKERHGAGVGIANQSNSGTVRAIR